jgi:predicted small secreted protein
MFRAISVVVVASLVLVGCATSNTGFTTDVKDDGTFYEMDTVGHIGLFNKGSQYTRIQECAWNREFGVKTQCKDITEDIVTNNSVVEQLAGPAATVGAAELLRRGIENSGDEVHNNSSAQNSNSNQNSSAYTGNPVTNNVSVTSGGKGGGGSHPGCESSGKC